MFCFIFYISLALLVTSNNAKSLTLESSQEESTKTIKIDLNALKNAAEVVKILKKINEGGFGTSSLQRGVGFGKQESERVQGIDIDYLGINDERNQKIRDFMEILQKNNDANENHELTRSDLIPRVYYISNPEVLEEYKQILKKKKERLASTESHGDGISNLWNLLKIMRREGEAENQNDVPTVATNIIEDDESENKSDEKIKKENREYLQDIDNKNEYQNTRVTDSIVSVDLTKIPSHSWEATEKSHEKASALRTAAYELNVRDGDINENIAIKKQSWESRSEENEKKFTNIFKAHKTREETADEKSEEVYKGSKKKKQSRYDDDKDDRGNNRFKPKKIEERKPYEQKRLRIKPQISKPRGNKASKSRDDSFPAKSNFHSFGRTPAPIVGKRGIYEDD